MQPHRSVVPLARWSAVVAIVLMGAALLVTAWTTHAGVRDASQTLVRGQANFFQQAIRTSIAESDGPPTAADLQALVDAHASAGLRFMAIVEPPDRVLLQAGHSLDDGAALAAALHALRPETPVQVGERVRMQFRAVHRMSGAPGERGRRAFHVVIEFEPRQAEELRAAAARTLTIGVLAASTLLLLAAALVRWALRREALASELERARRLASLGQLSAVLAHEIRNPLASLKGNAQLLAQSLPDGDKPRTRADRVVDEAIRLENLTNDLLEFVRTGELRCSELSPAALLAESAETVAPAAAGSAAIQLDLGGAPPTWSMDGNRMRQVLTNLLENAVQAGIPVRASVSLDHEQLVFEVRDCGPGVPEDDLERIFEPFYTRRTRGTGLGLAVAKRVVDLHAGSLTVANAPDGGAIFRVVLPRG